MSVQPSLDRDALLARVRAWTTELGFSRVGICGIDVARDAAHLDAWLAEGRHGSMDYMQRRRALRHDPDALVPGTVSVISVRMDCWPPARDAEAILEDRSRGYIARYALGRDYHKLMRRRLRQLARRLEADLGPFGHRVFADSAPILEKALARNAGLGWIGKHTLLLDRAQGSTFLLGEIFCDLELGAGPAPPEPAGHCGSCTACIDVCPTGAIVAPYRLDARRCISYLTIEHHGPIPVDLRKAIGNRIFGCDDCQLACPWNRHAHPSAEADFAPRHGLDAPDLVELFAWDESEYLRRTEGMALRRTGWRNWLRNVAVALGNAPTSIRVVESLKSRTDHPDELVREHVAWALAQHA